MKTLTICLLLYPLFALAQTPYFTAFGQFTSPTNDFAQASALNDAYALPGYGGGVDLNIHLNESILWFSTLTFSANKLGGLTMLDGAPFSTSETFSYYNLPALTGVAYAFPLSAANVAVWLQGGLDYAEFPNVSGVRSGETSVIEKVDTSLDGRTGWGFSFGARATIQKISFGLRYMNFGDYVFSGTYYSSATKLTSDVEFKSSISFLMFSIGYNLALSGD